MEKVNIKKIQNTQIMTWEKAKDMLIPEAQTFFLILKVLVAKICGNYCAEIYFAKEKGIGFRKKIKLYSWAILNLVLKIDVEPYLKKSILNKEIEEEESC